MKEEKEGILKDLALGHVKSLLVLSGNYHPAQNLKHSRALTPRREKGSKSRQPGKEYKLERTTGKQPALGNSPEDRNWAVEE